MKYLDRIRNGQRGIDSTSKSEQPYRTEPAKPAKASFEGFEGAPHKGTLLFFEASSLKQPSAPDSAGNIPYRLNIGNVTRLVWLPPGLSPGEVLTRAKVIYPDLEVSDRLPPHGWPRLADVPEVPKGGTPQPVECWTPSGKRLVVTAYSPEHAEQIRRMNPPPQGDSDGDLEGYSELSL